MRECERCSRMRGRRSARVLGALGAGCVAAALMWPAPSVARGAPHGALRPVPGPGGCLAGRRGIAGCTYRAALRGAIAPLMISPGGRFAYQPTTRGVLVLRRNGRSGRLSTLVGSAGCGGSRGDRGCLKFASEDDVRGIALRPDGRELFVATDDEHLSVVAALLDPGTGVLSRVLGPSGCLAEVRSDLGCGLLSSGDSEERLGAAGVTVSPDARDVYLLSGNYGRLWSAAVDAAGGVRVLTPSRCAGGPEPCGGYFPPLADVSDGLAVSPDGRTVLAAGGTFARDPASGDLTALDGPLGEEEEPDAAVFSADGRFAYTAALGELFSYRRWSDGRLRRLRGADGCLGGTFWHRASGCRLTFGITCAASIAISPDGQNVYAAGECSQPGGIVSLARDPDTGALHPLPGRWGCIHWPRGSRHCARGRISEGGTATISPDGRFVYITGDDSAQRRLQLLGVAAPPGEIQLVAARDQQAVDPGCPDRGPGSRL